MQSKITITDNSPPTRVSLSQKHQEQQAQLLDKIQDVLANDSFVQEFKKTKGLISCTFSVDINLRKYGDEICE